MSIPPAIYSPIISKKEFSPLGNNVEPPKKTMNDRMFKIEADSAETTFNNLKLYIEDAYINKINKGFFSPEKEKEIVREIITRYNEISNEMMQRLNNPNSLLYKVKLSELMYKLSEKLIIIFEIELKNLNIMNAKNPYEVIAEELGYILNPTNDDIISQGLTMYDLKNPDNIYSVYRKNEIMKYNIFVKVSDKITLDRFNLDVINALFPGQKIENITIFNTDDPSYGFRGYSKNGVSSINLMNIEKKCLDMGITNREEISKDENYILLNEATHKILYNNFGDILANTTYFSTYPKEALKNLSSQHFHEFISDVASAQVEPERIIAQLLTSPHEGYLFAKEMTKQFFKERFPNAEAIFIAEEKDIIDILKKHCQEKGISFDKLMTDYKNMMLSLGKELIDYLRINNPNPVLIQD